MSVSVSVSVCVSVCVCVCVCVRERERERELKERGSARSPPLHAPSPLHSSSPLVPPSLSPSLLLSRMHACMQLRPCAPLHGDWRVSVEALAHPGIVRSLPTVGIEEALWVCGRESGRCEEEMGLREVSYLVLEFEAPGGGSDQMNEHPNLDKGYCFPCINRGASIACVPCI